ncbi:major facilitator superfamily domain-containing protein [Lyophyllum atratum]|nr:major facilitator superfamily domain-containing protein [Lyophyllum atratum]
MAYPQAETLSYSDTDTKAVSKDPSVESVKLEAADSSKHDAAFERKTMRFVDWRILPLLALLYSFALIDRINLGAAYTAGMGADLGLTKGARYSIATCLYFVPYILFQLPGNLVLRKFGVRNWLTFSVVAWGAVQLAMGFVPTWGYLTVTRILLGALEASFFPAMIYIISTWYRRHEVQKRLAIFYLISITMGGISPILAYVFSLLDGKRGIRGWAWIFIIEGALTLFLGLLSWFYIPDFPDQNKFLTPDQTALVLKRIEEDRGDSIPDTLTAKKVFKHLSDWTLWSYGTMFMCSTLPAYAQAYFISIILRGLGWSKTNALLLSAPPYLPSIVTTLFFSWLSDRTKHRGGFIVLQALICIVGLVLTAFAKNGGVRYFGIFLTNAGNSGTIPGILAYASNNVVSHSKRSVQTALTVSLGGVGGIIASTTFRAQDAPRYLPGLGVTMGSQGLLILLVGITHIHFRRLNRLSRQNKLKKPLEGQPGFFYTL